MTLLILSFSINMLYNVNAILYKLFDRKRLLVKVYEHIIYRFYLTEQFVPWNFGNCWKKSLGFSGKQKEMLCLNL